MRFACVGLIVPLLFTPGYAQVPNALRDLFETLPQRFARFDLPSDEEVQAVHGQIALMSAADVRSALPAVTAALSHPDEYVRAQAASALFGVAIRDDGAALLRSQATTITNLLTSSSNRIRSIAGLTLLNMRLRPSPDLLRPIVAFLNRTDRDPAEQIAALTVAVSIAPGQPDVLDAVERFLSQPLEARTRAVALTAIDQSGVASVGVRLAVLSALDDEDPSVKEMAISVLTRMGAEAIADGASRLQSLVERPEESERVKAAVRDALRSIGK